MGAPTSELDAKRHRLEAIAGDLRAARRRLTKPNQKATLERLERDLKQERDRLLKELGGA